jgi:hypothetical protein
VNKIRVAAETCIQLDALLDALLVVCSVNTARVTCGENVTGCCCLLNMSKGLELTTKNKRVHSLAVWVSDKERSGDHRLIL